MLIESISLTQWTQITTYDLCYSSMDNKLKGMIKKISIPFFKYPSELVKCLINTWGLHEIGYKFEAHPYCCCMHILSEFEGFFAYVKF